MSSQMSTTQPEEHRLHKIILTPVESTLRRLLLDAARYVDTQSSSTSTTSHAKLPGHLRNGELQLRFTGGWVRDKLLGVDSHDIDVAIDKMTGYQFGLALKEYLETVKDKGWYRVQVSDSNTNPSTGTSSADETATLESGVLGGLHKIEANPEKSKHLETVTTKVLGLDIDLVNLRKETYTEDSRNPQMEFGTPEEDALRRDATVNALFYNLNTSSLEDLTGQGLQDMKTRIIRTPMAPHQTFKDDPLRVLRLIRFASRLGYSIVPDAEAAMGDPTIQKALRAKISRERVGTEIEKILKGPDPHSALSIVDRLSLYATIFTDPTSPSLSEPVTAAWKRVYDCTRLLLSSEIPPCNKLRPLLFDLGQPQAETHVVSQFIAWLITSLTPWSTTSALSAPPSQQKGKIPPPVAVAVVRNGLKFPNKVCSVVSCAFQNASEVRTFKTKIMQHQSADGSCQPEREVLGMAIRRWGPDWRSAVLLALLQDVQSLPGSNDGDLKCLTVDAVSSYTAFLDHLHSQKLLDAYALPCILTGSEIAIALNTKPGPWMKEALEVVMAWQLRHPERPEAKQEAIEEVRKVKSKWGL
ncbi:MAG: CCA tRNA nucleotidyltransferase, mitochondrial [Piccolia ochrophora]|nr:MAG: CCA tRNA nucleotidyltransferase, mitochondrial [Piccolia ochrophora]